MHQNPEVALPARRLLTPRRAAVVLVATMLGAAGGWFAAGALPPEHTAEATILLNPLEGNAFRPGGNGEDLVNLQTEAEVMRSDAMATAVAEAMPGEQEPAALLGKLEATVVTNTQILQVAFTARSAATAATGAQTFAEEYLLFRSQRAEASLTRQSEVLDQQIAQREEELDTLAAELAAADEGSPQATLLSARLQTVTAQLTQLSASRADLAATTIDPGQIVANATPVDPGPLTPALLLPLAGGLLVGAAAAAALWLRHRARLAPLWPNPPSGWPRIDWGYRGYTHPAHAAPGSTTAEQTAVPASAPEAGEPTAPHEPAAGSTDEQKAEPDAQNAAAPDPSEPVSGEQDLFESAEVTGGKTRG